MAKTTKQKTDQVTVAVLDADGVLTGYKQTAKPAKDAIVVPDDCDLAPGKFRWDPNAGAFIPLRQKIEDPLHLTIRAMAEFMVACRDQGLVDLGGCEDAERFLAKWEAGDLKPGQGAGKGA